MIEAELKALSDAATQGVWLFGGSHWGECCIDALGGDGSRKVNGQAVTYVMPYTKMDWDSAQLAVALVNAYRSGELVHRSAIDAPVDEVTQQARDAARDYHGPFCNAFGPTPMCCSCGVEKAFQRAIDAAVAREREALRYEAASELETRFWSIVDPNSVPSDMWEALNILAQSYRERPTDAL